MRTAMEFKNAPPISEELKAAIDKMSGQVEAGLKKLSDRVDEIEKKSGRPRAGGGNNDNPEGLVAERKALATFVRTGDETEMKALSVGSNPDGGYTVHSHRSTEMTKKIFDESPIRRLCRTVTITEGDAFEEPVDISEAGATWVGESSGRPATASPSLRMLTVPVNEIYAIVPVTQRLLDDSGIDIGAWVDDKIADRFARSEGLACVTGDGVAKPRGFMSYSAVATPDATRAWGQLQYVPSGVSGALPASSAADPIKDLYWSLRAPYRKNATWLMASSTANALDKIKDATGSYIWRDGMTAGAPPSLLGRPVEFDENLPGLGTADAFPIAFGDFKRGYVMVDKAGIRYLRDPFSSKPNVQFYATRRTGGDVADFESIKLLKLAAA